MRIRRPRSRRPQLICEFPGCNQLIRRGQRVMVKAIGDHGPQQEQVIYHAWHFESEAVSG